MKAAVTVVLGDLALLHDLNSLSLAAHAEYPVTIVVVNNRGGRIFEMLPVAKQRDHFEEFFAASHNLIFERAAAMFDLPYTRVSDTDSLLNAWGIAKSSGKSSLIEVSVDPDIACPARAELFNLIDRKLSEM